MVATVVSPTLVQCYTPVNTDFRPESAYNAMDKTLEVSLNGVDWTSSKKQFTFYDHSRVFVSFLEPQGGPLDGGTMIMVHGSSFRYTEHLRCAWNDNGTMGEALKVEATYIDYHSLKCITPRTSPTGSEKFDLSLEVGLDDYEFTNHDRKWTYYDPTQLVVSSVDPMGGPARGGTLLEVLGTGFHKLGGAVQHGSTALPSDSPDPHRRIDSGTFCKFSLDSVRAPRGEEPWCAQTGAYYDNLWDRDALPGEGDAAISRAASNRHLRNASCFTISSTPTLGKLTSVVQGTLVDANRMLCESPPFAGVLRNSRATLRVHVSLNGNFHLSDLSYSNATYTIYDPREARILNMQRTGGPLNGSTYVIIYGKLFFDFSLRTRPGYAHVLRCRFGFAGEMPATWLRETAIACYSPKIHGTGHRQVVSVDVTYNSQDYLDGPNQKFAYSPRDAYVVEGECRDAFGATIDGLCSNNFTGVAVSELQPFGGPSLGGTQIIVIGRLFEEQGPSIKCKFGNLSMVNATFLNETALRCISPPNPYAEGLTFQDHSLEVTLNGEDNFLTESKVPFVYYDHNATLAISSIYPQAGPKTGGNTITVYGSGFRVLGGELLRACDGVDPNGTTASELLYGPGRTEGSLSRGQTKMVGDSRVCVEPLIDGTNRGLQCIFGDMPPVHAYLLRLDASAPLTPRPADAIEVDPRVGTALICELPALADHLPTRSSYVPGQNQRELLPGSPMSVCIEVTLNGNRSQATQDCVEFTFYDT